MIYRNWLYIFFSLQKLILNSSFIEPPGCIIETIPAKRLGESNEIAEMVIYLVSEKAGYINGANFSINGGLRMD